MMSPCGIEIEVGQVWQEVDPRFERLVEVIHSGFTNNAAAGVYQIVQIRCHGRTTKAKLSRFTGKRGGYKLVNSLRRLDSDVD